MVENADFLADAYSEGQKIALAWANEVKRLAFVAAGLDIDNIDTFEDLLTSDDDELDESMESIGPPQTEFNFSAVAASSPKRAKRRSTNRNANNNAKHVESDDRYLVPSDKVLPLPDLEQKYDPMMESGESDTLPDLEELPSLVPTKNQEPESTRRPGLRQRRSKKKDDDDFVVEEDSVEDDIKADLLAEDEQIKDDEFVLEPLDQSTGSKHDPDVEISEEELRARDSEIQIVYASGAPKPCRYCDKKFRSLAQLAQHERCHTGEKPFVCKHCSKSFRQKAHLTTHLRIHTGERPFTCKLCGKGFIQSQHLKNHKEWVSHNESQECH